MADFNQTILLGRLTRDPELRYTPEGHAVCNFGMAVNRKWTAEGTGQQKEETLFMDVVAWRKLAEISAEFLKKGREVLVSGHLSQDKREGQSGHRTRLVAGQIQFLGAKSQ